MEDKVDKLLNNENSELKQDIEELQKEAFDIFTKQKYLGTDQSPGDTL